MLSDFKILKEDETSYHLAHPSGRKFVVDKKGLKDNAHAIIKGLPHFDEGGEVRTPDSQLTGAEIAARDAQQDATEAANAAQNQPTALVDNASPAPAPGATPAPASLPVEPVAPEAVAAPGPAPIDPFAQKELSSNEILDRQIKDAEEYRKGTVGAEAGMAQAHNDMAKALEARETPEQIVAHYKDKDDQLVKAVADGTIDPEHYWHSKSTGSKILSGIGIMMGGLASPAYGGKNPAMEQINNAINRDMDAQKNSQEKNMNLWKLNRAAMNTDLEADLGTRNQMLSITQAKVQAAQANASSATAKLRANQLIASLEQQKNENRFKMALLSAPPAGSPQAAGRPGVDPAAYVGAIVSPKEQDQAYKDLDQVQKYNSRSGNILNLFDQADKENTIVKTGGGMLRTPPSILAMNTELDALAKDREGRVNEQVLKDLKANVPMPGDLPGTVREKRGNVVRMLQEGSTSGLLDRYRVPYQKSSAGAPEMKTMGGVQYQKVPGGWQRVK